MRPRGVISALCIGLQCIFFSLVLAFYYQLQLSAGKTPQGKAAANELGIDWDISPLKFVQWSADDRLRSFEDWTYDKGFIPNAAGF